MTTTTTPAQIIEKVREIAKHEPDFIYTPRPIAEVYPGRDADDFDSPTACTYVGPDLGHSCLIGRALLALGVADASWNDPDSDNHQFNVQCITDLIDGLERGEKIAESTTKQRVWLRVVQARQDEGMSWGEAVIFADAPLDIEEEQR